MINRTAFLTSTAFLLVMLAATMWRIAILPDWAYGPSGGPLPPRNSWVLFILPACVAFVGGVLLALGKRLTGVTMDAARQWKQWGSHFLIGYAVICTLFHFYRLARSLGIAGLFSPTLIARTELVLVGTFFILVFNQMPKLPWLPPRYQIVHLDPARGARLLRLLGQLLVSIGLVLFVGAFVMPLRMMTPIMISMTTAMVIVITVRMFQLHREAMQERHDTGS